MTKQLLKLKKDFWKNVRMNMTDFEGQDFIESLCASIKAETVTLEYVLEELWFLLYDRWVYPFENFAEMHGGHMTEDCDVSFFDALQKPYNDGGLNY